jgi:hypothetical protein
LPGGGNIEANKMSSKKIVQDEIEVVAWVAKEGSKVTDEEIEHLEEVMNTSLGVERREDGSLALYSSDPSTKKRLDTLLMFLDQFQERRVYVTKS